MAEISAIFEALENQLMRAWMRGDEKELRKVIARDCIFMIATTPPEILDRPSFLKAMNDGFACQRFRFHQVAARQHGRSAWFVGHAELELRLGGQDWNGHFMLTDLWRKSRIRRNWLLAERSIAMMDADRFLSGKIHKLQLWH
ncbi:MAG: nuclear transport factor 2 family protein [Pseudomonadota bacterium]